MQTQFPETHTLESSLDSLFQKRREEYLAESRELFSAYMQRAGQKRQNLFTSLCGWQNLDTLDQEKEQAHHFSLSDHLKLFGASEIDLQSGGFFFTLEQKGICLNPGTNFFKNLCASGKTLFDIDIVIATTDKEEIREEIERIHSINRKLNQQLAHYEQEPHVIRFLLHPMLHAHLSAILRPEFRQEKQAIISLETFETSVEEEKLELAKGLVLTFAKTRTDALAVRFETADVKFGYLSHSGWHDSLTRFFKECRLMLVGIGKTSASDLEKSDLEEHSVGFFGLYTLATNLPKLDLVLLTDFSRADGDIRLELTKKLKEETLPLCLPLDVGMSLDFETLACITCTKAYSSISDVAVIRLGGPFSPLQLISKEDLFIPASN